MCKRLCWPCSAWAWLRLWAPLLFADTEQAAKATRDPAAAAERSQSAQDNERSHTLPHGQPAHSLATLLAELATLVSNTCRTPCAAPESPAFNVLTTSSTHHTRALALINAIHPQSEPQAPNQVKCLM